jgi:hypothetical protein
MPLLLPMVFLFWFVMIHMNRDAHQRFGDVMRSNKSMVVHSFKCYFFGRTVRLDFGIKRLLFAFSDGPCCDEKTGAR